MLFAFFTVFTFALMAEAVVGETVGALALSQAATDGQQSRVLHYHTLSDVKEWPLM